MKVFNYLCPKAQTKDSIISGKGTFAIKDIKKGEIFCVFGGRISTTKEWKSMDKTQASFVLPINQDFVISPPKDQIGDGDYINHSCNPNSGIRGQIMLEAMRDIIKGEEITFDYGMVMANLPFELCAFNCSCKSKSCRGKITPQDWKIPILQRKYKNYFSNYVQNEIDNYK